ncbi:hypothetical protein D1007_57181 [Hordeum vulgare]|nr:hypothetical protein D1007_57181 [Hordeum vulgare]
MVPSSSGGRALAPVNGNTGCTYASLSNLSKCSSRNLLSRIQLWRHMHAVTIIFWVSGLYRGMPSRIRHFIFRTPNVLSMTFRKEECRWLNVSYLPTGWCCWKSGTWYRCPLYGAR